MKGSANRSHASTLSVRDTVCPVARDAARGEALVAAVRELCAQSPDGRLPLGESVTWDIFPFEGELLIKPIDDPRLPEPLRAGVGGVDCEACQRGTRDVLWTDGRWRVRTMDRPEAVFVVFLEPLAHVDLSELDETAAAELGVLTVRVTRAIEALPGVGRVHVNRWGDGAEHLHIWFFVRPAGLTQLRGSCLPDWFDALPPMSQQDWESDREALRAALADS